MEQLYQDLNINGVPNQDEHACYHLKINQWEVEIKSYEKEIYFFSIIGPLPKLKREDFLTRVMEANFLGQGTGGGSLGITEDETSLSLCLNVPDETLYRDFKENLEIFFNYIEFWGKEIRQYEAKSIKH